MLTRGCLSAAVSLLLLMACGSTDGDDGVDGGETTGEGGARSTGTSASTTGTAFDGGEGSSCQSPLFWDIEASNSVDFTFEPGGAGLYTFACGPLEPIPTRWFRFTANTDDFKIEVDTTGGDDYIIEVFSDATCSSAASVGCNDNDGTGGPKLDVPVTPNKTYFIGVGLKGEWSGAAATLEVDG